MHSNPNIDKYYELDNAILPLEIVLRTEDKVDDALKKHSERFMSNTLTAELEIRIHKLLDKKFDHILTTNYGYEIEDIALQKDNISTTARKTIAVRPAMWIDISNIE